MLNGSSSSVSCQILVLESPLLNLIGFELFSKTNLNLFSGSSSAFFYQILVLVRPPFQMVFIKNYIKGCVHEMGPNYQPSRIWTFFIPLESVPKIKMKY